MNNYTKSLVSLEEWRFSWCIIFDHRLAKAFGS